MHYVRVVIRGVDSVPMYRYRGREIIEESPRARYTSIDSTCIFVTVVGPSRGRFTRGNDPRSRTRNAGGAKPIAISGELESMVSRAPHELRTNSSRAALRVTRVHRDFRLEFESRLRGWAYRTRLDTVVRSRTIATG